MRTKILRPKHKEKASPFGTYGEPDFFSSQEDFTFPGVSVNVFVHFVHHGGAFQPGDSVH